MVQHHRYQKAGVSISSVKKAIRYPKYTLEMNKLTRKIMELTNKLNTVSRKHSTILRSPSSSEQKWEQERRKLLRRYKSLEKKM